MARRLLLPEKTLAGKGIDVEVQAVDDADAEPAHDAANAPHGGDDQEEVDPTATRTTARKRHKPDPVSDPVVHANQLLATRLLACMGHSEFVVLSGITDATALVTWLVEHKPTDQIAVMGARPALPAVYRHLAQSSHDRVAAVWGDIFAAIDSFPDLLAMAVAALQVAAEAAAAITADDVPAAGQAAAAAAAAAP